MDERTIWISFDLGIEGDYEGLFSWLDENSARECGNNLAVLTFLVKNNLVNELLESLKQKVSFKEYDRIYVVYFDDKKVKGKFIVGRRKAMAQWKGYAVKFAEDVEDV